MATIIEDGTVGSLVARSTLALLQKEVARIWAVALAHDNGDESERLAAVSHALRRASRLMDGTSTAR